MEAEEAFDLAKAYATLAKQHQELVTQHAALAEAYQELLERGLGEQSESDFEDGAADGNDDRDSRRRVKARAHSASSMVETRDLLLFQIVFSPAVLAMLSELYAALDTQNQGYITEASFTSYKYQANFFKAFGTWNDIKDHFDEDGNNVIDAQEFVTGFARMAISQTFPAAPGAAMVLSELAATIQRLVDAYAQENIAAFHAQVAASLAASTGGVKRSASVVPSNLVYTAAIEPATIVDLSTTFLQLLGENASGTGSITEADFASVGLSLGSWDRVKLLFDEDESGTIEEKEFLEGFKKWVLSEPVSIPAGNPTLLEICSEAHAAGNARLSKALGEFKGSLAS